MENKTNKEDEFRSLFIMDLGRLLMDETYQPIIGEIIFSPSKEELNLREEFISKAYERAEKQKVELTLDNVYSFSKEYFNQLKNTYSK